jgi:hypothetical protein
MPRIDGILISGNPAFEDRTRQALELLGASATFRSVRPFLDAIRQAHRSGLVAWWGRATFEVGGPTWQAPLVWYAGAIVHDAGHARLYRVHRRRLFGIPFTRPSAWTGVEAERVCLRLQLAALREMNAGQATLDYVASLIENPTYQNVRDRTW